MNKKIFIILSSLFLFLTSDAQFSVSGKLVDKNNGVPVEFGTISLIDPINNNYVDGTTSDLEGAFFIETAISEVLIEISYVGYQTKTIEKSFDQSNTIDLGEIRMESSSVTLTEVTVRAERSTTEFKLDKRVFNVGQDLSSTGASGLDVLNNIPSVTVDIEGSVSLRGSAGVQILIDGKPSVMSDESGGGLGSITADMIEKVEVITNPSAKYDAEGTSGILNIVLRKEDKQGINGSISLNTGIPDNHSIGLSLNRRTQRFNLFTQMGAGYRSLPRQQKNLNTNTLTGASLSSEGTNYRNENFYNIRLGTDYYINDNNVLTLSGNFAYEIEDQPSEFNFVQLFDTGSEEWIREETTEATNPKWQFDLQYKRDFDDHKDHDLVLSALGKFFGKDLESSFSNTFVTGNPDQPNQRTRSNFEEIGYTFKADYTKPISEQVVLEIGSQLVTQDVGNDYEVADIIGDQEVVNLDFTNNFDFDQNVFAGYAAVGYERDIWGIKTGLRTEYTTLNTYLEQQDQENELDYTNFFPSAHLSLQLTENSSFQTGYSRRIYRPRLWDLNPFFNVSDNFNIRTGNPNLFPEFTDSYELTAIFIYDQISFNTGIYYRHTEDVIERITTVEDNVSITTPQNLGTSDATGLELNMKYDPIKMITISTDFNYNIFAREGSLNDQNFDFNAQNWTGRLNTKITPAKPLDIELSLNHDSAIETVQGERAAMTWLDAGVRYKVNKGKLVLGANVRDAFIGRKRITVQEGPNFYRESERYRGRFFTFNLSYGFGTGEAMQYTGRRRR